MDINEEKRKISRVDYIIEVQAKYEDRLFKGEIENISLNGFQFTSDETMEISNGEKITIKMNILGNNFNMESDIDCIVVRKINHILGLRFNVIDYDTLIYLKEKLVENFGVEKVNEEFIDFLEGN